MGQDFDNRIVDWAVTEFQKKHKIDLRANPKALGRLRLAAERVKKTLSISTEGLLLLGRGNIEILNLEGLKQKGQIN